jgi:hypothetical protein
MLAAGGLLHIFVYAEIGRWEVRLIQRAIALLQGPKRGDYRDGVQVGRQVFAALPTTNRLRQREETRWAMENRQDECFADMYVHPQEIDYSIDTLFDLIAASGLTFVGFSNPQVWQVERLLGSEPDLMARAAQLDDRQRYQLIEHLDPDITHFECFLAKEPFSQTDWTSDAAVLAATPQRHPCMDGWESRCLFNYDYQVVNLSESEFALLQACDRNQDAQSSSADLLQQTGTDLAVLRSLLAQHLITLAP